MKGTWQGSGTWQTSGPDLGDVGLIFVVVAAAGVVVEVVLSIIVWIAVALGIVSALAVALLVWRLRGKPGREARFAAAIAAQRERATLTATAVPQVSRAATPAIEQHVHYHYHAADGQAVPAIMRHHLEEDR